MSYLDLAWCSTVRTVWWSACYGPLPTPVSAPTLPTPEQIEAYQRDGFLVVPQFMPPDELAAVRAHFERAFAHEWETGLAPDEVNYTPGVTPPDRTRQLCNVWKADRTLARTTLSRRNGAFAAALAGAPGMRLLQDNAIWKPPVRARRCSPTRTRRTPAGSRRRT